MAPKRRASTRNVRKAAKKQKKAPDNPGSAAPGPNTAVVPETQDPTQAPDNPGSAAQGPDTAVVPETQDPTQAPDNPGSAAQGPDTEVPETQDPAQVPETPDAESARERQLEQPQSEQADAPRGKPSNQGQAPDNAQDAAEPQLPQKPPQEPPQSNFGGSEAANPMPGAGSSDQNRHPGDEGGARNVSGAPDIPSAPPSQRVEMEDEPVPEKDDFDMNKYVFTRVFINLENIETPLHTSREIMEKHVMELMKLFLRGNNPAMGTISITPPESQEWTSWEDGMVITINMLIVDGRHRISVFTYLRQKYPQVWENICRKCPATMIQRKDKSPLSSMEILGLSSYFNSQSSTVLKPEFLDHVHAAISTVRVLSSKGTPIQELVIANVTREILKKHTMGVMEERQISRYVAIALYLAVDENKYGVLKEVCRAHAGIGLTHAGSPVLLNFDTALFRLGLECVACRIENGMVGLFEDFRDDFYGHVKQLFDAVKKVAEYKEIETSALLAMKFRVSNRIEKSLYENIVATMGRYTVVENQSNSDKRRLAIQRKRMVQVLGEDIAPETGEDVAKDKEVAKDKTEKAPKETEQGKGKGSKEKKGKEGDPRRSERIKDKKKSLEEPSEYSSDEYYVESEESAAEEEVEPVQVGKKKPSKTPGSVDVSEMADPIVPVVNRSSVKNYLRTLKVDDLAEMMKDVGLKYDLVPREAPSSAPQLSAGQALAGRSDGTSLTVAAAKSKKRNRDDSFLFRDVFDDFMPNNLPDGCSDPKPYEGEGKPCWTRLVGKLPSRWPGSETRNPIKHGHPWLRSLYIPDEHRAHVFFDEDPNGLDMLRVNHHLVFWRAAHSFYKREPTEGLDIIDEDLKGCPAVDLPWAKAIDEDDAALEFFAASREQLNQQGYCIFEQFLDDDGIPEKVGKYEIRKETYLDDLRDMFAKVARDIPKADHRRTVKQQDVWCMIENEGDKEDTAAGRKGEGRFRMTNKGIMEKTEEDVDTKWLVYIRAFLEIRVGQVVAALKICDNAVEGARMFMPRTGGRWMFTSGNCERQVLHSDFDPLSRQDTLNGSRNPGYFVICTGPFEVPLWVCSGSHRILATASQATIEALSSVSVANLVRIPPWSIFLGRGDLQHAGGSYRDGNRLPNRYLRFYMYLIPEGTERPQSLQVIDGLNPIFKANIDQDSDESESSDEDDDYGSPID